jgi:hypothetical protein
MLKSSVSNFSEKIQCRMPGGQKKNSMLNLGHYFSIDLKLNTHYEYNVLTRPTTTITISHFFLRVVSAEFHTSRSQARHQRTLRRLALLDSYLYNLPSSVKIFVILEVHKE